MLQISPAMKKLCAVAKVLSASKVDQANRLYYFLPFSEAEKTLYPLVAATVNYPLHEHLHVI